MKRNIALAALLAATMSGGAHAQIVQEDYFVVNLSGSTSHLNVHSAPSTGAPTVGDFRNGVTLRNIGGCTMAEGREWCRVELQGGGLSGWVASAFLLPLSQADKARGALPVGEQLLTSLQRVQFAPGTSSTRLSGSNAPGNSIRYALGARNGQFLYVEFSPESYGATYRILNPDGSFLLDEIGAGTDYKGQLWQSGDHVVEIINRGTSVTSYDVMIRIE